MGSHGHAAAPVEYEPVKIKAIYAHLDCLLTGIDRLKAGGFRGYQVLAPLPRHEIEEAVWEGEPSPVRWWVLTGALVGLSLGFMLQSFTAGQWPLVNPGGKPVVSLPAFAIIMFECTILYGSLFNFLGMLFHAGLPAFGQDRALQDPRVTDSSFGIVFTHANPADEGKITQILKGSGAVEITTGRDTIYEVPNA